MMRILVGRRRDPKILSLPRMRRRLRCAAGLNHSIGEDTVTEAQAMETVKVLLDLGVDPKGRDNVWQENALLGPLSRME